MSNTEETLDFEQKHKEDLQRLRGFRLLDDDFMSKVFEDKACTEFLLQIILQKHDLKVQSVQGQYDIKNLQGRSIRLDISNPFTTFKNIIFYPILTIIFPLFSPRR